jgi:Glycosyltransferase family 87
MRGRLEAKLNASLKAARRLFAEKPLIAWLAAILVGGAIHLMLWPLSEPPTLFSDFMKAYWVAGEKLWQGGLGTGYPFTVRGNWSNLPILAWPFALLAPLGREGAGWAYLAIGVLVTFASWLVLVRLAGLRGSIAAALLFLFFLNGPLLNSLREGNSTHFVLLYLALGLLLWGARREYAAGLFFGMCATIKLPLLLLGVYFFVRRRWSIVAGGATTIIVSALLSLAVFGLAQHIEWYQDTIGINAGKAIPAFNVQSIDGFLMRLSTGMEELLYWGPIEPTLAHRIVRNLVFAFLLGGFGWLIWRAERGALISPRGGEMTAHDLLQFSVVLILALVTSPLSWTHYYLILLVPLALYLGGRLPLPDDAMTRWLFWPGYLLSSIPVIMPHLEIDPDPAPGWLAELAARTIVSAWLFGALLMLACFARGMVLAVAPRSAEARQAGLARESARGAPM